MKKRTYLKDGIKVSRLGFGAWPLGNTAYHKTMSIEEGITLVKKAYEEGINFFDTAPNYAGGRSETILGMALKDIRKNVVINSKFGHMPDGTINFSEDNIRPSIKESLKRLQTDYLDSVILHNPDFEILEGKTDHFTMLEQLKKEGTIKGFGVSIDTPEELRVTLQNIKVDVIELLYNVFAQSTKEQLDDIKKKHIALIIKVPLDSGWLTGKYTPETTFTDVRSRWTQEDKERRVSLVKDVKEIIQDKPLTHAAMGFLWSYDAVTTVIPGIRTLSQLNDHIEALNADFSEADKKAFELLYDTRIKHDPLPW